MIIVTIFQSNPPLVLDHVLNKIRILALRLGPDCVLFIDRFYRRFPHIFSL